MHVKSQRQALRFTTWIEQFACRIWGSCAKLPLFIVMSVFAMRFLPCCNHSSCLGEVEATESSRMQTMLKLLKTVHRGSLVTDGWISLSLSLSLSRRQTHTLLNTRHNRPSGGRRPGALRTFSLNLTTDGSGSHMKGFTASGLLCNLVCLSPLSPL